MVEKNFPYQNSAALLQFNHSVMRQIDFDRANIGGLRLTTLLILSYYFKGRDVGGVTDLKYSKITNIRPVS